MSGAPACGYLAAVAIGLVWLALAALAVRRLHDRGLSGWFAIVSLGFPVFWPALQRLPILLLPILLLNVWLFIEIYLRRGVKAPNRYGADPLAEMA